MFFLLLFFNRKDEEDDEKDDPGRPENPFPPIVKAIVIFCLQEWESNSKMIVIFFVCMRKTQRSFNNGELGFNGLDKEREAGLFIMKGNGDSSQSVLIHNATDFHAQNVFFYYFHKKEIIHSYFFVIMCKSSKYYFPKIKKHLLYLRSKFWCDLTKCERRRKWLIGWYIKL